MGAKSDIIVVDAEDRPEAPKPITLTLVDTTIDSKSDIPSRSFELTSDTKVVIGRSSKTVSKGLIPAATNGYFDSPVVSREHAVITADTKEGVVRLTDIKSLHGTSVNGTRLEAGVPFILSTGDKLRFGAHVARALDIFHPTECEVEIVYVQPAAPVFERARSYCAPESVDGTSDGESSDGYDSNSDEPLTKSFGEDSLEECESPTHTGGIQIAEDKPVEVAHNETNVRLPSLEEAMRMDEYEEEESEAEHEGFHYELDSDDGSSIENDDEMEESGDDEIEEDEYDDDEVEEVGEEEDENDVTAPFMDENEAAALANAEIDDDGSGFLENKIRQFMEKTRQESKVMDQRLREFKAKTASNVSSPEPTSAEVPIAAAGSNGKLDISSILNPSFPPVEQFELGHVADDVQMAATEVVATEEFVSIEEAAHELYNASQYQPVVYDTQTVNAEASAWRLPDAEFTEVPLTPVTPFSVMTTEDGNLCSTAVNAIRPVAAFHNPTLVTPITTPRKRKMDEVAAEDVQITVSVAAEAAQTKQSETQTQTQTSSHMLTPPPADGPAPKRQATPQSVAAVSQSKSKAWAAVEKLGIAALGGAVVLGSLIYTAPTF